MPCVLSVHASDLQVDIDLVDCLDYQDSLKASKPSESFLKSETVLEYYSGSGSVLMFRLEAVKQRKLNVRNAGKLLYLLSREIAHGIIVQLHLATLANSKLTPVLRHVLTRAA